MAQLRCFLTTASVGSVAEAGRRLGMTAASVSKAIRRLEDAAGVRLLHRSTHALSLTDDGNRLLEPAREAVRAAQAFEDAVTSESDGVVRVTAAHALVRHVLAPLVGKLDIQLDVRVSNETVDLADEGIDLAIRSGPLTRLPGHVQQVWFKTPWVLCAAPSYLANHAAPRTPKDLAGHALIGFRNRQTGRIQRWPEYDPSPRTVFDDGDAVWQAMLSGAGIACAPLYLAAGALRSKQAVEVLPKHRGDDATIDLVRRERRLTPARVSRLIAFLLAHAPSFRDLQRGR